ncbi:site-specific DNA-methyltransferase [Proteiniphilum propionicum]|jgi:adenine-specific DNA-methyltransferase|uniref:site-specific DNA-methyltransferase n=1 Tax=Proteiniphilum propionicum TaxID=2829812 RepID=UPI001EE9E9FF|nr:site-specific DNA-methyltransferase [Proteiniphilum propionicum]ULB33180.1 site-specific DNA-methyltransferase [Proteiniphilum propionicum]
MAKKSKYSHLSREQLEAKLEKLERERYGLVWEDKEEHVAKQCETELPVLKEDVSREIVKDATQPYNFIIEGDNFHSLYTLNFTHKKKIDVIYIDPPYNTGNNDFVYNDKFVDKTDQFRHSKWLSFMSKRLRLAKNLLKNDGAIFISIDNNECAQLKLLCDNIFGEKNFCGQIIWRKKSGGGQTDDFFVTEHEYVLCYRRTDKFVWIDEFIPNSEKGYNLEDERGKYKLIKLAKWGTAARQKDRPTMHYPINAPNKKKIYPVAPDGNPGRWRVGKKSMKSLLNNNLIEWVEIENEWVPYEKVYYDNEDVKYLKNRSIYYEIGETGDATKMLTEIFGEKDKFENPKPITLIQELLSHTNNSIVLDFFAGSASTGHAVLELNKEDGGNRQFILCTNNENNICEEVTYPRIKKVIDGYADKDGILANVKYFKQSFVPNVKSDKDKRELVNRSTELLCMAENTFENVVKRSSKSEFAIFKNAAKQTAIIYDEESIEKCVKKLNEKQGDLDTVIYVFSYDHTYEADDFGNLDIKFTVKPIPEAILNTYRKISKMRKK